jgi:hypothetical protein
MTFNELLQSPPQDTTVILLLDEADKLVPHDRQYGWQLFNILRALSNSGRIQVILSGERVLREALHDSTGPLFNFTNEMLLGRLDLGTVEELVMQPMRQLEIELVDGSAIAQQIYDFTSGHPNIVQRLCSRLIERLNDRADRRITLDDVRFLIEEPKFLRNDFLNTYWENATLMERMLSLLLAQANQPPFSFRDARRLLNNYLKHAGFGAQRPSGLEVDAALVRLADLRSILAQTAQGYVFAVNAFPRVVTQPGIVTIDDLLEMYAEALNKHGDVTLDEVADRERRQ